MLTVIHRWRNLLQASVAVVLLAAVAFMQNGCAVGGAIGAMSQDFEYQKRIEVPAKYPDLENKSVAVVVQADLTTLYEFPDLTANIASVVASIIKVHVVGATVVSPQFVSVWQQRTPGAATMAYGEMAAQLAVDRVVLVDIYEYRHNPPGNRYEWEGVCAANVGIIERDAIDPDTFGDTFNIVAEYPNVPMLTRQEATEDQIRLGLTIEFTKAVGWLFYDHLEPKYPDKYRPELDKK